MRLEEYLAQSAKAGEETDAFLKAIAKFQDRLAPRIKDLLSQLDITGGLIDRSEANAMRIGEILSQIDSVYLDDEFVNALADYLETYDVLGDAVGKYMGEIGTVDIATLSGIRIQFKQVLTDYLTNATSFRQEIHIPLARNVSSYIAGNGSYTGLIDETTALLTGGSEKDGAILGTAKTTVNDMLSVYERSSLQSAAEEVQAEFFLYQGRPIDTTREFCLARNGHAWEYREVQEWGEEAANGDIWSGMIPGTNAVTIFQLLGGYNCRHILVPISKRDVPAEDLARMKRKGLVS